MADLMKLQNGSDIRGIACEGVAGEAVNLTGEAGNLIGGGFVRWLADKKGKSPDALRIGIGHDSRITADSLFAAAAKGIVAAGAKVYDCGLVSTPSMFMTTVFEEFAFDGAIMITASHLPFNRNGYKFFDRDGGLEHDDITKILETASELAVVDADLSGVEKVDSISVYCRFLQEKIKKSINAVSYDKPLAGLHIVVDTGNGAGGFFVEKVLNPLGADTSGSQFWSRTDIFQIIYRILKISRQWRQSDRRCLQTRQILALSLTRMWTGCRQCCQTATR